MAKTQLGISAASWFKIKARGAVAPTLCMLWPGSIPPIGFPAESIVINTSLEARQPRTQGHRRAGISQCTDIAPLEHHRLCRDGAVRVCESTPSS